MNPCPCGFFGDTLKTCSCSPQAVHKYLQKISGPLLDRIDIHIEVPRLRHDELTAPPKGETSVAIRARVEKARNLQLARFQAEVAANSGDKDLALATPFHGETNVTYCNAQMTSRQISRYCHVAGDAQALLRAAIDQMKLSARAYDRILKLARTIADLAGEEGIGVAHIAEAVQYRSLDRKLWG